MVAGQHRHGTRPGAAHGLFVVPFGQVPGNLVTVAQLTVRDVFGDDTLIPQADVYRVREEEVPPTGTRVVRADRRTRWTDGPTHLWTSRRRRAGEGEASSGLRYDITDP